MKKCTSYEKEIITTIEKIKHTVRFKLNSKAADVIEILKQVPPEATVIMIVDDTELGGYGEVVFEE